MEINERLTKIEEFLISLQTKLDKIVGNPSTEPIPPKVAEPFTVTPQPILAAVPAPVPFNVAVPFKAPEPVVKAPEPVVKAPEPVVKAPEPVVKAPEPVVKAPEPVVEESITTSPDLPRLISLLNSKEWPAAVDPSLICDISSDQDKEDRAEGILDLIIDTNLENLTFLDFGCGEGHVVNRSQLHKTKLSVGYDINKSDKWNTWKLNSAILTDDWEVVKKTAPYNIVLIYDVIDHMIEPLENVIKQLSEVKRILASNGKVYVRVHPFCSRHGTHLYRKINKAYMHLVFTEEELDDLGYTQEKTRKIIHPLDEYKSIFTSAGFKIQNGPHQIKENVEQFFIDRPVIAKRIKLNYSYSPDANLRNGQFPSFQLEQQFLDYVLVP